MLGCIVGLMADEPIEPMQWCFEQFLLATVVETATGPKKLGACTADDVVYIVAELIASAGGPGVASEFAQDSWRSAHSVAGGAVEELVTSVAAGIVW